MKLKKDTTTGNLLVLGTADAVEAILAPGPYVATINDGKVNIWAAGYGVLVLDPTLVTHTLIDGSATAFGNTAALLMTWLSVTGLDFAPAA